MATDWLRSVKCTAPLPLAGRKFARSMGEHLAHHGESTNQSSMFSSGPLEASSFSSSSKRQTASFTIDSILGRPCSSATELCEGVEGPHVLSGALSSPPSACKGSQADTDAYSTIYSRFGYSNSKDSIPLKSSLDSGAVTFPLLTRVKVFVFH